MKKAGQKPKAGAKPKPKRGLTHPTTELGNAEHLIRLHGQNLRYVGPWQSWLVWDGKRWKLDEDGAAVRCAKDSARALARQALDELEQAKQAFDKRPGAKQQAALDKAERYHKWCVTSQNENRLLATLSLAASEPSVAVTHKQLDTNPMLFNCANGTVDLRSGKLQPHKRSDLITKLAPIEYKPGAKSPIWRDFIKQVMGEDQSLVDYLQRICGYGLTGQIREHALFFFYGEGNNGKSTFLATMLNMFGDYGCRASRGILFKARNERHPTSLATLHGKRFVVVPEIGENDELDEPLTKDLTGGDSINARRMREDEWNYDPTHKLYIAGNHKPRISGTDKGMWRRLRVLPWAVTIPDDKVDTSLGEKLKTPEVQSAVLAWCVVGCLAWQKQGLGEPPAVIKATDEYRKEQDVLGQFFHERLTFEPKGRMARAALRELYETWCNELGCMPMLHRKFGQALARHEVAGCNVRVGDKTLNGWAGVRLATPKELAERALKAQVVGDTQAVKKAAGTSVPTHVPANGSTAHR